MVNKELNNPSRSELITDFVKTNPEYYIEKFQQIGSKPTFSFSFNLYAAILGPIWFGMRNIWNWALAFLIIETFSVVQIIRGLFGNITAEAVQKIEQVQSTIAFRNKQLEAAITNNPDKVDVYKRNIKSLEDAMQGYIDEVSRIEASILLTSSIYPCMASSKDLMFRLYTSTLSGLFVIAASSCLFLNAMVDCTCSIF